MNKRLEEMISEIFDRVSERNEVVAGVVPEALFQRAAELDQIHQDLQEAAQAEFERFKEELQRDYQQRTDIAVNAPNKILFAEIEDALNVPAEQRGKSSRIRTETRELLISLD